MVFSFCFFSFVSSSSIVNNFWISDHQKGLDINAKSCKFVLVERERAMRMNPQQLKREGKPGESNEFSLLLSTTELTVVV